MTLVCWRCPLEGRHLSKLYIKVDRRGILERKSLADQSGDDFFIICLHLRHTFCIVPVNLVFFPPIISLLLLPNLSYRTENITLHLFSLNIWHGHCDEIRAAMVGLISDSSLWSSSVLNASMNYTPFPQQCLAICLPVSLVHALLVKFERNKNQLWVITLHTLKRPLLFLSILS